MPKRSDLRFPATNDDRTTPLQPADQYPIIEQAWPRMYTEFCDVYDRFAEREWSDSVVYPTINELVGLDGKLVVDIGAGTGRSTREFAKYARNVVAVEPQAAMRTVAARNFEHAGMENVELVEGSGDRLPLAPRAFDVAACVMSVAFVALPGARELVRETAATVNPGGHIVVVGLPPFWYAGELAEVVLGESRTTPENGEGLQVHGPVATRIRAPRRRCGSNVRIRGRGCRDLRVHLRPKRDQAHHRTQYGVDQVEVQDLLPAGLSTPPLTR